MIDNENLSEKAGEGEDKDHMRRAPEFSGASEDEARMGYVPEFSGASEDEAYMRRALELAKTAASEDEVPVGAIIVQNGRIISEAYNLREKSKCATKHAEIIAIEKACETLGGWRLPDCTMYVTLEPCIMCAGAIVNSRIKRVVFGATDEKSGAFGSLVNVSELKVNHHVESVGGCLDCESKNILGEYFKGKRKK
ncbi:MAG: tRNA adenosine(34) deaminase TadA [Eubacteriales bacterium]|nr:tRNA adenosine(34) deaminase TadA [Eubacteriales bacterium]